MVHDVWEDSWTTEKRWYLKQTQTKQTKKSMSEVSMCAECSCGTVLCVQRGEGSRGVTVD